MMFYTDYRLGGVPRHYISDKVEHLMRVPDDLINCVVYLCARIQTSNGIILAKGGTAFFCGLDEPEIDGVFTYLVTAKHVIDDIRKYSVDNKVFIRLNTKDNIAKLIETDLDSWHSHENDSTVDIAVMPASPDRNVFNYKALPITIEINRQDMESQGIGLGDEVVVTGLFVNHAGTQRNIPIVRTGNIAMLPDEPIETQYGASDVILVESRSIGGLSGSPVFVAKPPVHFDDGKLWVHDSNRAILYWLGVVHGHWDVSPFLATIDSATDDAPTVNMGIAIVVPAEKVLEVVNKPELKKQRKKIIEDVKNKNLPTPDSPFLDSDGVESTITRNYFFDVLEQVVKPVDEDEE